MRVFAPTLALAVLCGCALSAHATVGGSARRDAPRVQGVLNLNQATFDQLTLLPGIGPARAQRIVEHRARHPFKRIEELTHVRGLGRKTFARLRVHLAVSGPTTLQRIRSFPGAAAPATAAALPPVPAPAADVPPAPAPRPALAPSSPVEKQPRPGVVH